MLIDAIKTQYSRAFDILEAAVPSFTPEQWRAGKPPFDGPARAAAHSLACAERYTGAPATLQERTGRRIDDLADGELPSQEETLAHLAEVRRRAMAWADALAEEGLETAPEQGGRCHLERLVYAIRHFQHHTGEVCAYQKAAGIEPAPWS